MRDCNGECQNDNDPDIEETCPHSCGVIGCSGECEEEEEEEEEVEKKDNDDCEKAEIANHVYNTVGGEQESGEDNINDDNIEIVDPSEIPYGIILNDPNCDFNSALYRVDNGGGNIEYIYCTEGTASLEDFYQDVSQANGEYTEQYDISVENARALKRWAEDNGYDLSFVGHSLGGGLANANALATGLSATIFNPAGLSDYTISYFGLDLNNSSNVEAFVMRGEPIDAVNNFLGTPVRGEITILGTVVDVVTNYLLRGGPWGAYHLHSMGEIIDELDCEK